MTEMNGAGKYFDEEMRACGMLKWAFITDNGFDEFVNVHDRLEDAIRDADLVWTHMTDREKGYCMRFEVSLIHVEQDEDGHWAYYMLDSGMCDADTYQTAKDFLADRSAS